MSFQYTNAYIGPFCVSYAQGGIGEIQKFRFPLPVISREHVAQGLMITEGEIRVAWSHDPACDTTLGPGGSFALDRPGIPLAINAEVTLTALSPCAFLCITAAGIEQKVELERFHLDADAHLEAERYSLIAIAGSESIVRINGGEPKKGARLAYGKRSALEIDALTPTIIGKFSFAG